MRNSINFNKDWRFAKSSSPPAPNMPTAGAGNFEGFGCKFFTSEEAIKPQKSNEATEKETFLERNSMRFAFAALDAETTAVDN